tara:strand:+ start:2648 stop:2953 length:306 start_codon:yes stop_codon:yes gene_type:complete
MKAKELIKILLDLDIDAEIECCLYGRMKGKKYKQEDPKCCVIPIKNKNEINSDDESRIIIYLELDGSYEDNIKTTYLHDGTRHTENIKNFNTNLNLLEEKI